MENVDGRSCRHCVRLRCRRTLRGRPLHHKRVEALRRTPRGAPSSRMPVVRVSRYESMADPSFVTRFRSDFEIETRQGGVGRQ